MKSFAVPRKYLILLAIGGLVICLDQLTKLYIHTQFVYGVRHPVINGFFYLTYVRNPGAAFGIFSSSTNAFHTLFFLSMPVIAVIIILFLLKNTAEKDIVHIIALSMVFGGALGNYIDRLRFGYVIDFLDFTFNYKIPVIDLKGVYSWPAFNIADSSIVTGVCVLLLMVFLQWRKEKKQLQKVSVAS